MRLVLSLLLLTTPPLQIDLAHFKNFKIDGKQAYCLVDYTTKEIHCIYKDKEACANHYDVKDAEVCFSREQLKRGDN